MSTTVDSFDPYYKWLGIPSEEQPANYYRLLGLKIFESDKDVIQNAADQKMAFIRTFQTGQHSAESQSILTELSRARITLLDDQKKKEYDASIQQESVAKEIPSIAPPINVIQQPLVMTMVKTVSIALPINVSQQPSIAKEIQVIAPPVLPEPPVSILPPPPVLQEQPHSNKKKEKINQQKDTYSIQQTTPEKGILDIIEERLANMDANPDYLADFSDLLEEFPDEDNDIKKQSNKRRKRSNKVEDNSRLTSEIEKGIESLRKDLVEYSDIHIKRPEENVTITGILTDIPAKFEGEPDKFTEQPQEITYKIHHNSDHVKNDTPYNDTEIADILYGIRKAGTIFFILMFIILILFLNCRSSDKNKLAENEVAENNEQNASKLLTEKERKVFNDARWINIDRKYFFVYVDNQTLDYSRLNVQLDKLDINLVNIEIIKIKDTENKYTINNNQNVYRILQDNVPIGFEIVINPPIIITPLTRKTRKPEHFLDININTSEIYQITEFVKSYVLKMTFENPISKEHETKIISFLNVETDSNLSEIFYDLPTESHSSNLQQIFDKYAFPSYFMFVKASCPSQKIGNNIVTPTKDTTRANRLQINIKTSHEIHYTVSSFFSFLTGPKHKSIMLDYVNIDVDYNDGNTNPVIYHFFIDGKEMKYLHNLDSEAIPKLKSYMRGILNNMQLGFDLYYKFPDDNTEFIGKRIKINQN